MKFTIYAVGAKYKDEEACNEVQFLTDGLFANSYDAETIAEQRNKIGDRVFRYVIVKSELEFTEKE